MDLDLNWLAVLGGTVAHQALGALWYAVLFKNTWLRAMGMDPKEIQTEAPGAEMAFGTVASLVSVISLGLLLSAFDEPTVTDGVVVGAICGIGFVTAATFMNGIYEQKKPILSALFGSYYTAGLMVAGAILGAWR